MVQIPDTILVANAKGGCGKTTLSTTLATAFSSGYLRTALADADPHGNSLRWCSLRGGRSFEVKPFDWTSGSGKIPRKRDRLVIDSAAGLTGQSLNNLAQLADMIVIPVLPSIFDEHVTVRFVAEIETALSLKRRRTPILFVANRVQQGSVSLRRLEIFCRSLGHDVAATILEDPVYAELANDGFSLFDVNSYRACSNAMYWLPLVRMIETSLANR